MGIMAIGVERCKLISQFYDPLHRKSLFDFSWIKLWIYTWTPACIWDGGLLGLKRAFARSRTQDLSNVYARLHRSDVHNPVCTRIFLRACNKSACCFVFCVALYLSCSPCTRFDCMHEFLSSPFAKYLCRGSWANNGFMLTMCRQLLMVTHSWQ